MLGQRLLNRGAISAAQLESALEEQRSRGGLIGDVLRRLEFVSEDGLSRVLAEEAAVPFVTLGDRQGDPAAARLVPEPFARRHLIVPLGFRDDDIEVLQANPFDVVAVDEVQRLSRRGVRVVCGTRSDVLRLIERSYRGARPSSAETPVAVAAPPAGPARAAPGRRLEDLGLTRRQLTLVRDVVQCPRGILVVSGPAGAGKTTTIAALRRARPDAIDVGELPAGVDGAPAALRSATSAGLAVASSHGTDAGGAASRLVELGLVPAPPGDAVAAVAAQRLVRRICPRCRTRTSCPPHALARVGLDADPGLMLYAGTGCDWCAETGYRGCAAVFEVLVVDSDLLARAGGWADAVAIRQAAVERGMSTMADRALALAIFGQTSLDEVLKVLDG